MKLPPLNALRAFEGAARTGSFSAAGTELGVSSAAVSMQVRNLEDWLGLKLFSRRANQIRLTDAGREYYMNAASALSDIAGFTQALTEGEARQPLVIAATPALAQLWLPSRLQRFVQMRSDVPVRIQTETEMVDLESAGVDVFLTYGGEHPEYRIRPLFSDRLVPIAPTPDVDLCNMPLIDVDWGVSVSSVPRWSHFLSVHGLTRGSAAAIIAPSVPVAVSMVQAGVGVALLPETVLAQQIAAKTVCRLTDRSLPLPRPYVMITAHYKSRSRRLQDLAVALGVL